MACRNFNYTDKCVLPVKESLLQQKYIPFNGDSDIVSSSLHGVEYAQSSVLTYSQAGPGVSQILNSFDASNLLMQIIDFDIVPYLRLGSPIVCSFRLFVHRRFCSEQKAFYTRPDRLTTIS